MNTFKFGIMGAGAIANKFIDAVSLINDCEVTAVSSKSMERARNMADKYGIKSAYDSYEDMLKNEELDAVYIAATTDAHYQLTLLCLKYKIPVLCEKAMFTSGLEAKEVFEIAKKENIFLMEAMWSRFLPAINKAKQWIDSGKIGNLTFFDMGLGFIAPIDFNNRYYSAALGGGVAYDLTVYTYELATYLINKEIKSISINAVWSETGVDLSNHITLQYEDAIASLKSSFVAQMEERMVIYGTEGKIVVPKAHFASEAILTDKQGNTAEHFIDDVTKNGFTYEAEEVIKCIREGKIQSDIVPHELTIKSCELYDEIYKTKI